MLRLKEPLTYLQLSDRGHDRQRRLKEPKVSALRRHRRGEISIRFLSFKSRHLEQPLPVQMSPPWTVLSAEEVSTKT